MKPDRPILLASSNAHKLDEIRAVFAPLGIAIEGLDRIGESIDPPVEDADSFVGNATLKARYYAQKTGRLCLADDSGLVVDALDGRPGIHSARYAGVTGDRATVDAANNRKLLEALSAVEPADRTARFVCVMVLADADRVHLESTGQVEGHIATEPRGGSGFGYDPLFIAEQMGMTAAEMTADQKNSISHRGRAARAMAEQLVRCSGG
jgi:XTP/dITP diphosphohydrolase